MRIQSKQGLIDYIMSTLGAPMIKVDVTVQQVSQIIDNAVQKFTEYAYGHLEESIVVQMNGIGHYPMPDLITNIKKVSRGAASNLTNFGANFGSGYVPDLWSQQYFSSSLTGDIIPSIIGISTTQATLAKYFGDDIYYNFNPYKKDYTKEQLNAWANPKNDLKTWEKRFEKSKPYLCMLEDEVVGFCEYYKGYIDCFYVHFKYQNCGIGKLLFTHILKLAKNENIDKIKVDASITAKSFFEKFGFKEIKKNLVKRENVELVNFSMEKIN